MLGWLVALGVLAALGLAAFLALQSPRADRDWAVDQAVAPRIEVRDGRVEIEHVRDFRHPVPDAGAGAGAESAAGAGGAEPEVRYRELAFDVDEVVGVWLVLAPFALRWRGLAHTFLSFELTGGRFLAVSVEARRERDETYSLLGGLLRRFEVAYVVGTEEDLIGLRALRGDVLYVYPGRTTPEEARALLLDMLRRARELELRPEFYNTLTDNCTTAIRHHVNRVAPGRLPWGWGMLLPGYADGLALKAGLLDTDLGLKEARRKFRVDEQARRALAEGRELSRAIRGREGDAAAEAGV